MTTTTIARAWSVERADGLTLGLTDHDAVLRFNGIDFRPQSGLTASAVVQSAGLSVDNSEAVGILSDDAISEADLRAGRWDGAAVRLWEIDWTAPESSAKLIFRGSIGEVTQSGMEFRADLRGLSEPLGQPQGRVYHPRCTAQLGDGICRVGLDSPLLVTETVVEGCEDARVFRWQLLNGFDDRWFERGILRVETGPAAGLSGMIKNDRLRNAASREVELWGPLGIAPREGDRLRLVAGCDKRAETCRLKFNNYLNFRGFPHLPPEDWLVTPQVQR